MEERMKTVVRNLLNVVALVVLTAMPVVAGAETVGFPSLDKRFHGQLTATLYMPSGTGPFPAMVLLHTCAGIQAYLRTRPEVDGNRIGIIGWSHGGGAALVNYNADAATDARTRVAAFLTSVMK
jgi:dienelactone hydrolase